MKKRVWRLYQVCVGFGIIMLFVFCACDKPQPSPKTRRFEFKKAPGISIEVLPQEEFQDLFAENPDVPKTNHEVCQLADSLCSTARQTQIQVESQTEGKCGEYYWGTLLASLSNPDITDSTRTYVDAKLANEIPSLPETYPDGHFEFYYTTNDPDSKHNVTLADIKATAIVLNRAWTIFTKNFTEPKSYVDKNGRKMIKVKVYYDSSLPTTVGATNSGWDYIFLKSNEVKDTCARQVTPGA